MGIPEMAAKHAVFKTGGNNADMAVTWYFENMADESLNYPLMVPNPNKGKAKEGGGDSGPPQDLVD